MGDRNGGAKNTSVKKTQPKKMTVKAVSKPKGIKSTSSAPSCGSIILKIRA